MLVSVPVASLIYTVLHQFVDARLEQKGLLENFPDDEPKGKRKMKKPKRSKRRKKGEEKPEASEISENIENIPAETELAEAEKND